MANRLSPSLHYPNLLHLIYSKPISYIMFFTNLLRTPFTCASVLSITSAVTPRTETGTTRVGSACTRVTGAV